VLILDVSHGGDVILTQKELSNFKDLKGKTVGLEKNSMGIHVLSRALGVNDMQIEDINLKIVEGYEHINAFDNQKVDGIVTYEPMRTKLLKKGANEVFNSKQMPNEIIDVLIVRKAFLETHIKQVTQLIEGWYKSLAFYKEHPEKSRLIFSQRLNLDTQGVKNAFNSILIPSKQENLEFFTPNDPSVLKIAKDIETLMLKNNYLQDSINTQSLLDYDRSLLSDMNRE